MTTDADGNPTGTIGCLRDVTEEQEIERALEAAHDGAARSPPGVPSCCST